MSPEIADPILPSNPGDPLFTRAAVQRLFCAVGDPEQDAAGNVRRADVRFFDRVGDKMAWYPWEEGKVLHWNPFRLRLNNTPRAGLHVTSEWMVPGGEMRYGSNFKITEGGIFALNPSNIVCLGEPLDEAVADNSEKDLLDRVLLTRFGLRGGYREVLKLPLPSGALPEPGRFLLTY